MKKIKISTLLVSGLVLGTGFMLFNVSRQVQEEEKVLYSIQDDIVREEKMIRVLRAEWAYLNRPERLERLAKDHLEMGEISASGIVFSPASLPSRPIYMPPPMRPVSFSRAPAIVKSYPARLDETTAQSGRAFDDVLRALPRAQGDASP